jgi:hypothetical protein
VRKHPGKFVGALPDIQRFIFRIECQIQDKCFEIHLGANFGLKVLYREKSFVHFVVPLRKIQLGLGFPKLQPSAVVRWHQPANLNKSNFMDFSKILSNFSLTKQSKNQEFHFCFYDRDVKQTN